LRWVRCGELDWAGILLCQRFRCPVEDSPRNPMSRSTCTGSWCIVLTRIAPLVYVMSTVILCSARLIAAVLSQDLSEEAFASFAKTRDAVADGDHRFEFELLREQVRKETYESHDWIDFVKQPGLRKRCIIGWLTMFGAQGTATLVINSKHQCAFETEGSLTPARLWTFAVQESRFWHCTAASYPVRLDISLPYWELDQCPCCRQARKNEAFDVWLRGMRGRPDRRVYHSFDFSKDWKLRSCFRCSVLPIPAHHFVRFLMRSSLANPQSLTILASRFLSMRHRTSTPRRSFQPQLVRKGCPSPCLACLWLQSSFCKQHPPLLRRLVGSTTYCSSALPHYSLWSFGSGSLR
jgi:hypothetical protein